jgi:hypothetical protein
MTKNADAVRRLFRGDAANDRTGNSIARFSINRQPDKVCDRDRCRNRMARTPLNRHERVLERSK